MIMLTNDFMGGAILFDRVSERIIIKTGDKI
jgi:hypothetical protein